jgi:8-amino-3,8-dideoxy-alpha-D-manno-octulosonate transaminase
MIRKKVNKTITDWDPWEVIMPGFEIFGAEEKKEVADVLDTGVLFRYGFEKARNGQFKAAEFEKTLCTITGSRYSHLCSSGTAALSTALAACGIGAALYLCGHL